MPVDIQDLIDDSVALEVTFTSKTGREFKIHVEYRPLWYTWQTRASVEEEGISVSESNMRTLVNLLKSWDLSRNGEVVPLEAQAIKDAGVPIRIIETILVAVMQDMPPPKANATALSNGSSTAEPSENGSDRSPIGLPF